MPANTTEIEKRLWDAADDLRANSKLKSSEYSMPVLGLIFLRYADYKFEQAERELNGVETLHAVQTQHAGLYKTAADARSGRRITRRAACYICASRPASPIS